MIEKKDRVALALYISGVFGVVQQRKNMVKIYNFYNFLVQVTEKKNKVSYTSYSLHTFVTVTGV